MTKEIIFEMTSPYRDTFRIQGYRFGKGELKVAIVGTMRGDEVQQQYICSQIINRLKWLEKHNFLAQDCSILIIPSCNPFSLNVAHRFWAMDSTDINRMFPGYDKGETTQRIAAAVFKAVEKAEYGMQLSSFYIPGNFIPHIRMLDTGYQDNEGAKLFGMPYVTTYKPKPFDTTLLNYNWQIWNTKAFSVYGGETDRINPVTSEQTIDSVLRFLYRIGVVEQDVSSPSYESRFFNESVLQNIQSPQAGIFSCMKKAGDKVMKGEVIARIIDPYEGNVIEEVVAPCAAIVFFVYNKPLILQNAILFKLLKSES